MAWLLHLMLYAVIHSWPRVFGAALKRRLRGRAIEIWQRAVSSRQGLCSRGFRGRARAILSAATTSDRWRAGTLPAGPGVLVELALVGHDGGEFRSAAGE